MAASDVAPCPGKKKKNLHLKIERVYLGNRMEENKALAGEQEIQSTHRPCLSPALSTPGASSGPARPAFVLKFEENL